MRYVVMVAALLFGGCAAHSYLPDVQPPSTNLSKFVVDYGLARIGSTCTVVMVFANSRSVHLPVDAKLCGDAETYIALDSIIRNSLPAPVPAVPDSEKK